LQAGAAVAPLFFCNRRERDAGWAIAPSTRRVRRVSPLLGDGTASAKGAPVAQDGNGKTSGEPPTPLLLFPATMKASRSNPFRNFAFAPTGMGHSGWGLAAARKAAAAEAALSA
ncbi:MAG: hypothetical protein AABZ69_02510, partial [Candidatus Binatota bacterium]